MIESGTPLTLPCCPGDGAGLRVPSRVLDSRGSTLGCLSSTRIHFDDR